MANIIKRVWNQNRMVQIEDLKGMTFQAEQAGHTFQISGIDDDGNTVALTGTPAGVLLRPDNTDVALTCSVSGGVVSATLPANCYDVPGRFGLTIFITSGSSKTAIYAAVGTVTRTSSGTVAPGTSQSVVDLINAINAAVNSIPASYSALLADIAPTYSDSALYGVGQYAWYDGDLKRCIVPITTAESYTAAHWTSAVLGQDVSDLKSALIPYNSTDLLSGDLARTTATHNGVTYTWNGETCTVSTNGSASTGFSVNVMLSSRDLPKWVKPGQNLFVKYNTTDNKVRIRIIFRNSSDTTLAECYLNGDSSIIVPTNAAKWTIGLVVGSGSTINNATVSGIAVLSQKPYSEIWEEENVYNAFDLLNGEVDEINRSTNGIAYKCYNGEWDIDGTSSGISTCIILPESPLPKGITPGKKIIVYYNTTDTNVRVRLIFRNNNSQQVHDPYFALSNRIITIPENATRWTLALYVESGKTLSHAKASIYILNARTNEWLTEEAIPYIGVLASGSDLDDLVDSGRYSLQAGNTYDHSPLERDKSGILEVLEASNNRILQRITCIETGSIYNRVSALGSFEDIEFIMIDEEEHAIRKYVFDDLTDDTYNPFRVQMYIGKPTSTQIGYRSALIPIKKGSTVHVRTAATYPIGTYAKVKYNYLVTYKYPYNEDHSALTVADDTFVADHDGFVAVNCMDSYYKYFLCEIDDGTVKQNAENLLFTNALQNPSNFIPEYDEENPCKVLKKGASLVGAIHHWGVVGASYDSGELNFTRTGATAEQASSLDYYEYSWMSELARMNGIPDVYHYSNGGQNAKQWITLTGDPSVDGTGRGFCYPVGVETISQSWNGGLSTVSGIGPGGGCWWKMRADHENGDTKQAFILVLGSNDINNNNPHNSDWEELDSYDESLYYKAGSTDDIGTYEYETDTDTVPSGKTAGVVPGIVNSYAAYIGAILNRIIAIQPNAVIFVATIRNNFAWNENSLAIWNGYNNVLKQIVQMDQFKNNCYLIDFGEYGPNYVQEDMYKTIVHMHPNAIGYHEVAYYYGTLIDYVISKNLDKFKQTAFIGTGKKFDPVTNP